MKQLLSKFLVLAIFGFFTVQTSEVLPDVESKSIYEDGELTPIQLISKYGYHGETHNVITEDGYILGMHRITGPNSHANPEGKQPVLVMHPLLSSSVDFIITGPGRALGYVLADEGYDVWLGNVRGNTFSRKHIKYTDNDKEYWQFSWHENGIYDLPAMIDYILEKTNRRQILYVGHSMGTTVFWVMASERPEYQEKVKAMVGLGPVAYLTHMRSFMYHILARFTGPFSILGNLLGQYEFAPSDKLMGKIEMLACNDESWIQPLCTNTIFLIAGPVSDQLNATLLPVIFQHVPAGGSVKQILHYLQVLKARKFQQYDHGLIGNRIKYKQFNPPVYDLSKIKVPVYLHYGSNDWLTVPKDIERLYKELGNPIQNLRVPYEKFSHLDFIWAKDSKELIYNTVIAELGEYKD